MLAIAGENDGTLVGEVLADALVGHAQGGSQDCGREKEEEDRLARDRGEGGPCQFLLRNGPLGKDHT